MGRNSGTIRKVVIGGVTYDVPGDINITFNITSMVVEGVPTSGTTMFKMTTRIPTMEGIVVMTDKDEAEALRVVSESLNDTTLAVVLADGTTYRSTGRINYENLTTEEMRSAIQMIPAKTKNAWVAA